MTIFDQLFYSTYRMFKRANKNNEMPHVSAMYLLVVSWFFPSVLLIEFILERILLVDFGRFTRFGWTIGVLLILVAYLRFIHKGKYKLIISERRKREATGFQILFVYVYWIVILIFVTVFFYSA